MSPGVAKALRTARQALDELERAIGAEDAEQPIPVKLAAHQFGASERAMQRAAKDGCGVKVKGRWQIFPSRILMPSARR